MYIYMWNGCFLISHISYLFDLTFIDEILSKLIYLIYHGTRANRFAGQTLIGRRREEMYLNFVLLFKN